MTEPTTVNVNLIVPNTGDLPGAWGTAAVNVNMVAVDGMFGGFTTIGLSASTTFALTTPGTPTPGAGPNQSQNACIYLTGALTGNVSIRLTTPKSYVFHNQCTGTNWVQLGPVSGTGTFIGLPPGRKVPVFFDGTNVDFLNPPEVGSGLDLRGATTYLPWMTVCTIAPYLIADGSVYSTSAYTALAALLGSTFGGNGITTFAVPDERARARIALDVALNTTASGRLSGASGVTGTTMGSAGGSEFLQGHLHTASVTDPGHTHYLIQPGSSAAGNGYASSPQIGGTNVNAVSSNSTTNIGVTISSTGTGASQNVQPSIVSFLPLIKT